ncbi:MAG: HD domain-containing phosphohydrolase [Gemmatimonadota bacterium]
MSVTARKQREPAPEPGAVVRSFAGLVKSVGLYPDGHPSIGKAAEDLRRVLAPTLETFGTLSIDIIDGEAHVDGRSYRRESDLLQREIQILMDLGIESLSFESGVAAAELLRLAESLTGMGEDPLSSPGRARVARLVAVDGGAQPREWPDRPEQVWDSSYAEALERADETFDNVAAGGQIDVDELGTLVQVITESVAGSTTALSQILLLKEFENHTYCHSVNVTVLSLLIGERIGLSDSVAAELAEAALLHDIGKMRIPKEILNKPGALDAREWQVVKRHPRIGAEMLLSMNGLHPLTPTVALEHHMECEGGGYPEVGSGHRPHPISQLVAVADVYESLTGARSYRDPATPQEACLILARLAGQKLNPALVRTFVSAITFFPPGTIVKTSLGEIGVVVAASEKEPLHPTIRLIEDQELSADAPIETSRRDSEGNYVRHIQETVRPDSIGFDLDAVFAPRS